MRETRTMNNAEIYARTMGAKSATYRVERRNEDGSLTVESEETYSREPEDDHEYTAVEVREIMRQVWEQGWHARKRYVHELNSYAAKASRLQHDPEAIKRLQAPERPENPYGEES